jgi:hypothetical protein
MLVYNLVTAGISKASCSNATVGTLLHVTLGLAILLPLEEEDVTISLEILGVGSNEFLVLIGAEVDRKFPRGSSEALG